MTGMVGDVGVGRIGRGRGREEGMPGKRLAPLFTPPMVGVVTVVAMEFTKLLLGVGLVEIVGVRRWMRGC